MRVPVNPIKKTGSWRGDTLYFNVLSIDILGNEIEAISLKLSLLHLVKYRYQNYQLNCHTKYQNSRCLQ